MTIHHATIKKAEKLGIILSEVDNGVQAHWAKMNHRVQHSDPKVALEAMAQQKRCVEAHGWVNLTVAIEDGQIQYWGLNSLGDATMFHALGWVEIDSTVAAEADKFGVNLKKVSAPVRKKPKVEKVEPTPEEPEVVKPKSTRKEPDELAKKIAKLDFNDDDGNFQCIKFAEWLERCGVVVDKKSKWYAMIDKVEEDNTAAGRFRMIGRQKLERAIAKGTAKFVK